MSTPGDYGIGVFPQHAKKLAASGVSPEVAAARGYRSADTKAALGRLGFGDAQRRPPALVIPLHGVTGEPAGFQLRPDEPRSSNGRVVKYETPSKQRMVLDVPPAARGQIDNPAVPLFITEGPIKADSAVSVGLCCVALLGVWNWRGTNEKDGRVALAAFESIALHDRRVVVAFDSDAFSKESVHEAMTRLAAFLAYRGAHVLFLYLPHGYNGSKVGLDDFLAQHPAETLWDLCSDDLRPLPGGELVEPEDDFSDLEDESGVELLDDVHEYLVRYCSFGSAERPDAIASWVLHTYVAEVFSTTPRLAVTAATIECGKTRVLETIEALVQGPRLSVSVTGPYLFRTIGARPVTLLLDEYENIWRDDSDHGQDLRAIIDAGHRRGATVGRVVGQGSELVPHDFEVFCPVALAGVGRLPDSVRSRSVVIRMRRRGPDETVEPYEREEAWSVAGPLRRRLGAWAMRNRERLVGFRPALPDGVVDRPADVWRPLLAIAHVVGGHWPETIAAACVRLTREQEAAGEDLATRLLDDIKAVFDGTDLTDEKGTATGTAVDRMFSTDLVERLCAREDWPWGALRTGMLTPHGLAKRLSDFDVRPKNLRIGDRLTKGYDRSWFVDAWTRFAHASVFDPVPQPLHPLHPLHPSSGPTRGVTDVTFVTATDGAANTGMGGVVDLGPLEGSS